MLREIAETVILGVGLAAVWFYLRSLLSGDLSNRSVYRWAIIMVPLGIAIVWGMKVVHII